MKNKILTSALLLGTALFGQQAFATDYKYAQCKDNEYSGHNARCLWNTINGADPLPPNTVRFDKGTENGVNVYVCRDRGKLVGKYINGTCYVPSYGKEYAQPQNSFEILEVHPSYIQWEQVNTRVDLESNIFHPGKYLIKSGRDSGYPMYVCGVKDGHGNYMTGKLVNGHCWYAAGGREYNYSLASGHVYVLWYTGPM
ncbi:hypothetical protein [Pseudoalteromonas byunsanensis]|uniref:Uncharacterized protein n=1 Tax=Pseudoalteromonas byunsanensis TaxID=327939 RepID=A0A1S1N8F6_9GAMM|nr:hypothetical protein [Pseudoalteromonas byunsanensis]OHU94968.1 hypothetical protein BIW53_13200 [Pseudoalteromonas byunsanensis]